MILTEKLDLKDAIHVGHSTGGGEVARYIGRHGQGTRSLKSHLITVRSRSAPQKKLTPGINRPETPASRPS